jgi:hypothetical protein
MIFWLLVRKPTTGNPLIEAHPVYGFEVIPGLLRLNPWVIFRVFIALAIAAPDPL